MSPSHVHAYKRDFKVVIVYDLVAYVLEIVTRVTCCFYYSYCFAAPCRKKAVKLLYQMQGSSLQSCG